MTNAAPHHTATPIHGAIQVLTSERLPDGETCVTVSCEDYDALNLLPGLIDFGGLRLGRTGWNSDLCIAYYKTGWPVRAYARSAS